jgi:Ala-tRNA(Pro) deacylase
MPPGPATREQLMERLAGLGIDAPTVEHEAVFTVEESQALRGELPGGHIKNLFLKGKKGDLWLVVCLEDRRVDLKKLEKRLGARGASRFSFGKPELLMEVLGVEPGSVTPFAVINDPGQRVTVVLDEGIFDHDVIYGHPLVNTASTMISPDALMLFLRDCGHEPVVSPIDTRE